MTIRPTPTDEVRHQYDDLAGQYETRWRSYVESSVEETIRRMRVASDSRVLDIGCGTGVLLSRMMQRDATLRAAGVDLSVAMLSVARSKLQRNVTLTAGDAERLPFAKGVFDVVVSSSSFHYWPSPTTGLVEIRRVLKNTGQLIITDWCDDFVACRICDRFLRWTDPAHRQIYGMKSCVDLLSRAGYAVEAVERYRISFLWGLMTAIATPSPA
jgi:ubiquinone/menaquinone biosynthesis C-methylase UbiE